LPPQPRAADRSGRKVRSDQDGPKLDVESSKMEIAFFPSGESPSASGRISRGAV
jgi:hypothetical protein